MYAKLLNNLETLKLEKMYSYVPNYLDIMVKEETPVLDSLVHLTNKENILFYGTPGVEKTHLTTAIGVQAASKRYLTYFITCHDLIQNLRNTYDKNCLKARLEHYNKYRLLIIDEIRYLPVRHLGNRLFFQLIIKRYEHNSTIITTNQSFSKWGDVFSNVTLTNAILNRLLLHSYIVKIVEPSYRTKDVYALIQQVRTREQLYINYQKGTRKM